MEHIVQSHSLSKNDVMQINHCQLAFQAMTVVDIVTSNGLKVTRDAIALRQQSQLSST
jgi:hypothetical protein